jgi:hypothetical protein
MNNIEAREAESSKNQKFEILFYRIIFNSPLSINVS